MKICIIKLGALGDVIRTIPLLEAIKEKYPDSEITWITRKSSLNILETNPHINNILLMPASSDKKFDILYNFDIEEDAITLASKINADKKYGFFSQDNYPSAFNFSAEYYLNTLFDDDIKKTNNKTYQEMMFNAAELGWKKQKINIYLTEKDRDYAKDFFDKNNLKAGEVIGIHIGSSPRWPSKSWHESRIIEFIKKIMHGNCNILLLAGPDDIEKQKNILKQLKKENMLIATQDPFCTVRQFSSLVSFCKTIVCSDSLALHVSLALNKPTIGLFFCTSPNEVEGYGLLTKIVSPLLKDFFPEKSDQYNEKLVNSIPVDEVMQELS